MLKLTSLSLIFLLTFSQKAHSYKVNVYEYECDTINILVNEKFGIRKEDLDRYFDLHNFWVSDFFVCDDENLILSKKNTNKNFLQNFQNRIKLAKKKLKNFDNFPSSLKDLMPNIVHQKRAIEFGIWLQEIRLEFFKTGDINVLRNSYLGVPPSKEILDIVDNIVTLKDDVDICRASFGSLHDAWFDYYYSIAYEKIYNEKCMTEKGMQDVWHAFETKYKIHGYYYNKYCD
jgi:hypothetical protein